MYLPNASVIVPIVEFFTRTVTPGNPIPSSELVTVPEIFLCANAPRTPIKIRSTSNNVNCLISLFFKKKVNYCMIVILKGFFTLKSNSIQLIFN